jgi:hypothetical protein
MTSIIFVGYERKSFFVIEWVDGLLHTFLWTDTKILLGR